MVCCLRWLEALLRHQQRLLTNQHNRRSKRENGNRNQCHPQPHSIDTTISTPQSFASNRFHRGNCTRTTMTNHNGMNHDMDHISNTNDNGTSNGMGHQRHSEKKKAAADDPLNIVIDLRRPLIRRDIAVKIACHSPRPTCAISLPR